MLVRLTVADRVLLIQTLMFAIKEAKLTEEQVKEAKAMILVLRNEEE